jgi:hypothetical protein
VQVLSNRHTSRTPQQAEDRTLANTEFCLNNLRGRMQTTVESARHDDFDEEPLPPSRIDFKSFLDE